MGAAVDEHVVVVVAGRKEEESSNPISTTTHINCNNQTTNIINKLKEEATPTRNYSEEQIKGKTKVEVHTEEEVEMVAEAGAGAIEKMHEKSIYEMQDGHLPKASPPPQVIIIPAQQASTVVTNAAKKVRRALSMPRNPFRWSRKFKTSNPSGDSEAAANIDNQNHNRGGSNSALSSCVGGGRGRSGSIVSLNSYEAVAGKDPKGNKSAKANGNTLNGSIDESGVGVTSNNASGTSTHNENGKRVLRRSSLRKFVNRFAHQLRNSINAGQANKQSAAGAGACAAGVPSTATTNGHHILGTTTLPTDRVPPIGGYQWPADQTPGVMGLKNHGNTCFMNAVLQCLSHTDILAEYFVLDLYKADLKRRNKINSRKFGTKGELTEQLANVLKALWTCKNESDHSTSFKAVVERYGSQFRSSTQHDAQEFLFWLLDKVHEDLNTATKRRYKSAKNNYGRPDEIIAAETLANHIRCNNSFVQAVFQAQFRSSLTCPRCKKQSNTFDPFHCISVQLPQLTQQTIFATIVYLQKQPKQVRYGLRVPAGSPIVALREQLHIDAGIASDSMVLVDLNEEGFTRVFYDSQPVVTLNGIETIYCIETPSQSLQENKSNATSLNSGGNQAKSNNNLSPENENKSAVLSTANTNASELLVLVANVHKKKLLEQSLEKDDGEASNEAKPNTKEIIERFGAPFSLLVPRDCSYLELQKKLLREMSSILKPEVFSYSTPLKEMFRIRLQDPSADPDTFLEQVEHPLLTEMIDLALSVLSSESGPPHVKLLLEWSEPEQYFSDLSNSVVEHESFARLRDNKNNDTASLTLEQCLEHYTKAETLSAEDAWRCPHCQQYLPVVKTLGLWSLPDILVVHFKRFRQHQGKGPHAAKLTTMVNFPLNAFDMSPHLAKGTNGEIPATSSSSEVYRPSPWRKSKPGDSRSSTLSSRADNKETRYDLYAVCYHQGETLETGHYTAACKNPYDRQWYKFDDQRVTKVPNEAIQEEIINNEAYMLFYQRRNGENTEYSGSSSNSSDHWVSRIVPPPFTTPAPLASSNNNSTEKVNENKEEKIDKLPEKAESKPVDIPKIPNIDQSDLPLQNDDDDDPEEKKPQVVVTIENTELNSPLENEEISYADDDDDEMEILPEIKQIQEKDHLKVLEEMVENPDLEDNNPIFVMDEDNNLTKPNTITVQAEINGLSPTKTAEAVTLAPVVGIISSFPKRGPAVSPNSHGSSSHATSSISSSSSTTSVSSRSSPHSLAISTAGASNLQTKFNGFAPTNIVNKEIIYSTSLKSNSSGLISAPFAGARSHEFHLTRNAQQNWHGSRSSVSAVENGNHRSNIQTNGLNLRHSFSTSSNYKFRECTDTLSSLLRNSTNTCSKDTLLFIDQQNHLIEDDDTFMGSRSLWISPVTSHKLITVSPKN